MLHVTFVTRLHFPYCMRGKQHLNNNNNVEGKKLFSYSVFSYHTEIFFPVLSTNSLNLDFLKRCNILSNFPSQVNASLFNIFYIFVRKNKTKC